MSTDLCQGCASTASRSFGALARALMKPRIRKVSREPAIAKGSARPIAALNRCIADEAKRLHANGDIQETWAAFHHERDQWIASWSRDLASSWFVVPRIDLCPRSGC